MQAFVATLLKLFKVDNLKKQVIWKLFCVQKLAIAQKKKMKEKKNQISEYLTKEKTPCEAANGIEEAKTALYLLYTHTPTRPPHQSHRSVSEVCSVEEILRTWEVRNGNCFRCLDSA